MKPERPEPAKLRQPKITDARPDIGTTGKRAGRGRSTAAHGPIDRDAILERARALGEARRRRG